jgi:hypothetical protein
LRAALDPAAFAQGAGIDPDPWQREVLRSDAPRILLNVTRQGGKSTTTSVLAVHAAVYQPESLVLIVSPSSRQSAELFRKCLTVYRTLGRPIPATAETALRLELENGSRIISLPGQESTLRGYSAVSLLCLDEAARIEDGLYYSLRPMMAISHGKIIAMSTPWGRRGWWFTAWQDEADWHKVEVPASLCPRISPEFLAAEQRTLGPWWYRQEYCCQFSDTVDQVFSSEVLAASLSSEVKPLFQAS